MQNTSKLYEAFGELLYVVAMADGKIQEEEIEVMKQKLADHPWGEDIQWSFDYEVRKGNDLDDLYKKVINYCEMHGPEKEYQFLIDLMEEVAKANAGVDAEEQAVMDNFVRNLTNKFKADIERINA